MAEAPLLIVVMGPSGCGKSTIARALADKTGGAMIEGDAYHPIANKEKMAGGTALSDKDRAAWLDALTEAVGVESAESVWLACSALTPYVQERLRMECERATKFVALIVPREVLAERITARTHHFMPASLLESQLEALAPPADAIHVDANQPLGDVEQTIIEVLGL